ncbi:hypothetical protein ACU6T4_10055 [Avibacterium paragallinarum]|uniref:hypothetical protein n=1 Tax=Avibacterium paragallinarum TaxID=728 RepID=UPI00021AD112|nr:hypothetical protein [Avibacterium paragallinarum]AZI14176.1 hypothetical protein EIA51_05805 [Avibacterium paragallinarum]QIR11644.1 hypothetical protein HBL79_04960 [Avibacterium paragallinarum]QJE09382.1 hypothetical protein HHJ62_03190 [Avibacterium paragallinarum]QJE11577.1 hypothetical protein HHJ61_03190 [Avibacterium paragallinarum]QJE13777.1 hypothetical protein HHJ60_03200 [Avibacterium paragallinarum]
MKKTTALLSLAFAPLVQAGNWGSELKAEMTYSIYQECSDDESKIGKLAKLMDISKATWCGCLLSQMQTEFDKMQLEQRLNQGEMTIKQFEQSMEQVGEKAADYCVERHWKN